jgi:hypothetical protein
MINVFYQKNSLTLANGIYLGCINQITQYILFFKLKIQFCTLTYLDLVLRKLNAKILLKVQKLQLAELILHKKKLSSQNSPSVTKELKNLVLSLKLEVHVIGLDILPQYISFLVLLKLSSLYKQFFCQKLGTAKFFMQQYLNTLFNTNFILFVM